MSANIGWLFYKDYFKEIDYQDLENPKNETSIKTKVQNIISKTPEINEAQVMGNTHFSATTTYPGLLLGSGNAHEVPHIKGQAILGFHFDYTSGLPLIQGSSIKGVLRSAFKHPEYISEYVQSDVNVEALEEEIFDNGDIFFDATISISDGKILGDDFITPHGDALKNPIPLRFIKVLPNITWRFDFQLSEGLISRESKIKLFEHILEDLGLGAKTNVGYGKFTNFKKYQTEEEESLAKERLEQQKIQEKLDRENAEQLAKEQKAQKAEAGLNTLSSCKTLADGFKLLKDSFGIVPKPTPEQKEIINEYYKKQKNLSKSDEKVFKKYLK